MNSAGKEIVLVGGGHAHVHVLPALAESSPNCRVTLITRDLRTPYSGMLPGVVAGLYSEDEAHIDLVNLTAATGARLIHAEAVGLDPVEKRVLVRDGAAVAYDLVSIDVGVTPSLSGIAGAAAHAVAVKPIGSFLDKFARLLDGVREGRVRSIAVIGGGAGGVELLLSLRTRVLREAGATGIDRATFRFALVTAGGMLDTHNARVQAAFRRAFKERGIALHEGDGAAEVRDGAVVLESGQVVAADCILVSTQAAAPEWFVGSGLALDPKGFIAVGPTLQSTSHPDVFAAGDCAAMIETPREKAGVYAVRAGPVLARNLALRAAGHAPKPWVPQRRHLALISTGEKYAIASRGWLKLEGRYLWTLKEWIDRRWMRQYQAPTPRA